jgi:pimeloyl-ACP methyl ester carboxylesterase
MIARWIRRSLLALAAVLAVIVGCFVAVIVVNSPAPLPRLAAGDTLPGIEKWNVAEIPAVSRVSARDGAPLTYRLYPGRKDKAVVLVHGSSGASISMHKLGQALQAAGATVYSISLRGHGGSGSTNGDSSYRSQLDDDLADVVKAVGLEQPAIHRTLIGFSSGGGFVLREASGGNRALFNAYLAISPYIAQDSPTTRPAAGGWVSVAVPRLIGLSILDGLGLPWFQGLPVIRFATAAEPSENRTPVYSYRLMTGMQLNRDWRGAIAGIDRPTIVAVGARDELFHADDFQPLFGALNPRISVVMLPGLGHMDMITSDAAVSRIASLWLELSDGRFDFKVREDMFAGFDGDKEASDRAMKQIDDALARDPDNAEALTWRGAGRLFQSGEAFKRGALGAGRDLARQGLTDLERAGALQPDSIAVHAARGPALMQYARYLRPFDKAQADRLIMTALGDFDFLLDKKETNWSTLAAHDRGEILGGLAEGWLQVGDAGKAAGYLDRMIKELPGTPYANNASSRRTDPSGKVALTCLGCH